MRADALQTRRNPVESEQKAARRSALTLAGPSPHHSTYPRSEMPPIIAPAEDSRTRYERGDM